MSDLLNNGSNALQAFQRALTTTSQNISNVNTEGYSRQRVNLESVVSDTNTRLQTGSGVRITNIERLNDEFATGQVRQSSSALARQTSHLELVARIDSLTADDALSLTPALSDYFNAIQDANNDPSSSATREIIVENTNSLVRRFQGIQQQFNALKIETDERVETSIADVNEISSALADVNRRIVSSTGALGDQAPNILMDKRDQLINDLSKIVDVRTLEQENGATNVFVGNGMAIVIGENAQKLRSAPGLDIPSERILEIGNGTNWQRLDTTALGGELAGLRDFTRDTLNPAMNELGRLALVMADSVNSQHRQGIDLQGNSGLDVFSISEPEITSNTLNSGTAILSATVNTPSLLAASDYRIEFDGSGFITTRISDGLQTTGTMPIAIDGIEISIGGTPTTGDSFIISPTKNAAGHIENNISSGEMLALSSALTSSSSLNNLGTARMSTPTIIDPDNPALSNLVEVVFTSDDTLNIVDTTGSVTLASGITYSPGTPLQFNGWEIQIEGNAKAGDTHRIDPALSNHGSNGNGLALAEIQYEAAIQGTQTLNDSYSTLVSQIGGKTRSLQTRSDALQELNTNALERQQSAQGVNLDEEAVNLSRLQQAYQASAQIIATADNLFQTVLGVVAR